MTTPVAFIIFNRPDTTEKVFAEIRRARPPKLYLIADGPRTPEEKELTDATRAIVSKVDWDCTVQQIYSDQNLGCRQRVISGLNEIFATEEEAIILEDDCLPDPSFFSFCQTMLERYKNEPSVMHIAGNNFQQGKWVGNGDYYFSNFSHIWGWATWARAWKYYQPLINDAATFIQKILPEVTLGDPQQIAYWTNIVQMVERPGYTAWSYHWLFAIWLKQGKCILPNRNLVYNIGFEGQYTHTRGKPAWYDSICLEKLTEFSIPEKTTIDIEADRRTFYLTCYSPPRKTGQWQRLKNLVKKLLAGVVFNLKASSA